MCILVSIDNEWFLKRSSITFEIIRKPIEKLSKYVILAKNILKIDIHYKR
jgi:hypothetical protein